MIGGVGSREWESVVPNTFGGRREGFCLASCFDRFGGTEYSSRTVFSLHSDVGVGGSHQHGRLEAVLGAGSQGLESAWARACQHLPAFDLRGAVPAGEESHLVPGATLRYGGGPVARVPVPGEAESPVGSVLRRQPQIEKHLSIMIELRDSECPAPAYEDIRVGQHLGVAGSVSLLPVRVGVLVDERGGHPFFIDI